MKVMTFIAFEWVDSNFLSMTADSEDEDFPEFTVSKETLRNALGCEENDVESSLMIKLPLVANITYKEREIQEIDIC